jgi:hypothetical protein
VIGLPLVNGVGLAHGVTPVTGVVTPRVQPAGTVNVGVTVTVVLVVPVVENTASPVLSHA